MLRQNNTTGAAGCRVTPKKALEGSNMRNVFVLIGGMVLIIIGFQVFLPLFAKLDWEFIKPMVLGGCFGIGILLTSSALGRIIGEIFDKRSKSKKNNGV